MDRPQPSPELSSLEPGLSEMARTCYRYGGGTLGTGLSAQNKGNGLKTMMFPVAFTLGLNWVEFSRWQRTASEAATPMLIGES
jgi:hypothetical protein